MKVRKMLKEMKLQSGRTILIIEENCKVKSMIGREHILQGLAEHVKDLGFTKDVVIIEDFEAQG